MKFRVVAFKGLSASTLQKDVGCAEMEHMVDKLKLAMSAGEIRMFSVVNEEWEYE